MTYRIVNVRERVQYGERVKNIGRVEKSLKLIIYLKEWHMIKECAIYIGVSPRSIQRYFKMLMCVGFKMETNYGCHYVHRITNVKEFFSLDMTE